MARPSLLAPFEVRSFRFQWPADMLTSWANEMEVLILGWYILTTTGSVVLLTVFSSMQYAGTLLAPVFGLAGDRLGHRNVLCVMRSLYGTAALLLTALVWTGVINPWIVFAVAGTSGLVRLSDLAMRNALVANTMPQDRLMAAMGVARTTTDSARIFGSVTGASLFALLGMGRAYMAVAAFYFIALLLTFGVSAGNSGERPARASFWRDLREGMTFITESPQSLAGMWLAFLVNVTAFPLTIGLLPYVAREIYHFDQTGLSTLVASFAGGALTGSIAISMVGRSLRPARMMLIFSIVWHVLLLGFVWMPGPNGGRVLLLLAGCAQSFSMVPLAVMLLHTAGSRFRGQVMGVRMFAVYGLPIGLIAAGLLIERIGFVATASGYCVIGAVLTVVIGLRWRRALWPVEAAANAR